MGAPGRKSSKKKIIVERPKLIPVFEKTERLTKDDITCKICYSVFINPVTFPCNHTLCKVCFDIHIKETSLKCPFCNFRLSVWSRQALRNNSVVNVKFMDRIELEFPNEVAAQTKEQLLLANEDSDNDGHCSIRVTDMSLILEDDDESEELMTTVRDAEFCEPGEIAKDLEIIYDQHRKDLEKERLEELEASQILIEQIVKEEQIEEDPNFSQIQLDFELAQRLQSETAPATRFQTKTTNTTPSRVTKFSSCLSNRSGPNKSLNNAKKKRKSTTNVSPLTMGAKRNKNSSPATTGKQSKINQYFNFSSSSSSTTSSTFVDNNSPSNSQGGFLKPPLSPQPCCSKSIIGTSSPLSSTNSTDSAFDSLNVPQQSSTTLSPSKSSASSQPWSLKTIPCSPLQFPESPKIGSSYIPQLFSSQISEINSQGTSSLALSSELKGFPELLPSVLDYKLLQESTTPVPQDLKSVVVESDLKPAVLLDDNDNVIPPQEEINSVGPEDVKILNLFEVEQFMLEKRRQEEEDLKIALQLQKLYDTGLKPRGRSGSNSEKYSLRAWMMMKNTRRV